MERLQKIISSYGYTSRRKAEELITKGKVRVNGIVAKLGDKANYTDTITIDGKVIEDMNENKIYILLNKPRGVVTTTSDEKNRKTVLDLIDIDKRVYPVGRLDYDTTGVLLLTNDGKLTNLLTHPSNKFNKTYVAKVKGFFTKDAKESLSRGVNLGSYISARAIVRMKKYNKKTDTSIVEVTIHEGKNHEVKNMFKALGYDVIKLKRDKFGFLDTKGLKSGEYRYLSTKEVKKLYGNI